MEAAIRNLYFMGFDEGYYPSLLILPDQIGSSRTAIGLIGGSVRPSSTHSLITTTDFLPLRGLRHPPTNLDQTGVVEIVAVRASGMYRNQ